MALTPDVKRVLDILRTEFAARPAPTVVGKAVTTAADAAAARSAVGAGTSNLTVGTTAGTAKDGAWKPAAADVTDSTATGRSVLTATDAAAARTAIGAGTSSLTIGTTASTAKAGNYQPTAAQISDATTTGRSVLTATDAAAARTAIGAGVGTVTSVKVNGTTYQPTSGLVDLGSIAGAAGATTITTQHGAPTGTITNPILDLDTGLLYTGGSPAIAGSSTQVLTAAQQTMDSTTGWWFNTGTTMSGGKLTVPAASNAVLTVPATPGQTLRASVHVDSGADVFLTCLASGGQQKQGYGTGDLLCPDYVVPAGVTSVDFNCEAYNGTAVFDNISVLAITAGSGGYTTQTLGGGGGGNVTRVVYANSAYPARPGSATYVEWVGPVQPTAMQAGDTWTNTAA